jgi:hypothetical protein
VPQDWASLVVLALSFAAAGTTALMGRLLLLVARPAATGRAGAALVAPWIAVLLAVGGATWVLPGALLPDPLRVTLSAGAVWDGLWPVGLGAAAVAVGALLARRRAPALPEVPAGDVVVVAEAAGRRLGSVWSGRVSPTAAGAARRLRALKHAAYLVVLPGGGVDRLDRRLTRWRTAGVLFAVVTGVLLWLVPAAPG